MTENETKYLLWMCRATIAKQNAVHYGYLAAFDYAMGTCYSENEHKRNLWENAALTMERYAQRFKEKGK